jgi:hypothetical protein
MRLLSQVTSSSCCKRNWSTHGNLYSLKKSRLEKSRVETMVYVHNNLHLIYRQREEWVKGKTNMWDVFPDDMGLDNSVELALANLDLNDLVLELVTFDDGDPLQGSYSIAIDAQIPLDIEEEEEEEEDGEESSGEDTDIDDDYFMEEKYY